MHHCQRGLSTLGAADEYNDESMAAYVQLALISQLSSLTYTVGRSRDQDFNPRLLRDGSSPGHTGVDAHSIFG